MNRGFFVNKDKKIDLTLVPGKEELLKPKAPPKTYDCQDCGRCAHALIKVRDYDNDILAEYDENGKQTQKEKLAYKLVEKGGEEAVGLYGEGLKKILIVTDEVTEGAVLAKKPIIGQELKLLRKSLKEVGLDLERDCWLIPSVRGVGDAKKIGIASKACRLKLHETIREIQPKVVVTLGFRPLSTLIAGHGPSVNKDWEKYCAVDETAIPDQILNTFVIPTLGLRDIIWDLNNRKKRIEKYAKESLKKNGYISQRYKNALDPAISLIENPALWSDDTIIKKNWVNRAMRTIVKYLEIPFKKDTTADNVEVLTDKKEILEAIAYFMTRKVVGTDIETPSLKPYRKGNKIFCIGFSDGKRSVGYSTNDKDIIESTKKLLTNPDVKFIIHNLAFEWKWFKRIWGIRVENIYVDSLIMQHAWDHRTGCAGLKYAVYTNYGVVDSQYDGKCKPFFNVCDADKDTIYAKSEQAFNKFDEALERGKLYAQGLLFPLEGDSKEIKAENKRREKLLNKGHLTEEEQLKYVAMDSEFCFRLVKTIQPKLSDKERAAIRFYTEGVICLAHVTDNGMKIDPVQLQANIDMLDKEIEEMHVKIMQTEEAKKWTSYIQEEINKAKDKKEKDKLEKTLELNYNSNAQLAKLLFKVLGYKPLGKTSSGAWATDATTLSKLDSPICNLIIERKKKIKSKDTYLMGWVREADEDNIVHPNFNLGSLTSHRSSANSVNSQNSPKRSKEMKTLTRNFIIPHRKGAKIISGDYTGAETRCMASIAQDKQMELYMMDSDNHDMHRDGTIDVFKLEGAKYSEELLAELRGIIKNGYTFPEFYGDYYGNCAKNIWENLAKVSEETQQWLENHMIKNGIGNLESFTEHMKECERILWKVRFKDIDKWKEKKWKEFIKLGYSETVIGFRLRGRMNRKQVGNYNIQGPSWAVLLQGMIYLDREIERLGEDIMIINEIHDDCITEADDSQLELVKKLYVENLLIKPRESELFKGWMSVPFKTDLEIHDKDNLSWATKPTPIEVREEDYTSNYITF